METPSHDLFYATWRIVLQGSGFQRFAPFHTQTEAYGAAQQAREKATNGESFGFRSIWWDNDGVHNVLSIGIERWDAEEGLWRTHSHSWRKRTPTEDALTPLTADAN
jgi:hypothetical protein